MQALVGKLRLIYPNPDRHLGPDHRVPTIEEARAVVHLAVMIVHGTGRSDRPEVTYDRSLRSASSSRMVTRRT